MNVGDTLKVFQTKYGNILPITCIDFISDDVQYLVRYLPNNQLIEVLANINLNPAAWEFMREASLLVNRHLLFVSITNTTLSEKDYKTKIEKDKKSGRLIPVTPSCEESGYQYGHTSLFGSLRKDKREELIPYISKCFRNPDEELSNKNLLPSYENLIFQVNPGEQAMLVYELNLRVNRLPSTTQAPDQGYSLVRSIEVVQIEDD